MLKIVMPVVFLCAGLGIGVGAGVFLAPADTPEDVAGAKEQPKKAKDKKASAGAKSKDKKDGKGEYEYLKLTKQFVIPVVEDDQISAMVTMSLSLAVKPAATERFYAIEPKLRDSFLQVLFDHANTGGFDGAFTQSGNLDVLRKSLFEVAHKDLGDDVSQVLIMSINRQDT